MDEHCHILDESFLHFDFGGFDLVHFDDEPVVAPEISVASAFDNKGGHSPSLEKLTVKKSKRVYPKKKSPYKRGMTVSEALIAGGTKPNMSRRPQSDVLVAFPHYDKCDSLIYFPHAISRHMNSGDMKALSKLVWAHLDRDCDINVYFGSTDRLSARNLIRYVDIANEVEPDRIMCVHSTKVMENKITATIYQKQTDSQRIFNFMSHTLKDLELDFGSIIQRFERFALYDKDQSLSPCAVQELMFHASLEEDLLVYLRTDLVITFDDVTKKIVAMDWVGRLTSANPVPEVNLPEDGL